MPGQLPSRPPQPQRPTSYLGISTVAGVGIFAVALAIGGLTGLGHTEYKTGPLQQAILLVLGGSCYGAIPGLLIGLLIDWRLRRRRQKIESNAEHQ